MRRPILINLFLLLLVLLLAGLVWLSSGQQEKQPTIPLTSLVPDQITLITIENDNGPAIKMELEQSGWVMTQPSRAKVKSEKIAKLLEISKTKSTSRFEAPQKLTEYGLNPPQAVLTLNQTRIEMGGTHPINHRRYMRIGNMIHLINDRFPHHLLATPDSFISTADKNPH
jgi:hypothetical protein